MKINKKSPKSSLLQSKTHQQYCPFEWCTYQNKSKKNSNLKRHYKSMHSIRNYIESCSCGQSFKTQGEVKYHNQTVHKGIHQCLECLKLDPPKVKVFNRHALLKRHLAIHTGFKPFKCPNCMYRSSNKANCKRHFKSCRNKVSIQGSTESRQESQESSVINCEETHSISSMSEDEVSSDGQDEKCFNSLETTCNFTSDTSTSSSNGLFESNISPAISTFENKPTTKKVSPKKAISHSIESILRDTHSRDQPKAKISHLHNSSQKETSHVLPEMWPSREKKMETELPVHYLDNFNWLHPSPLVSNHRHEPTVSLSSQSSPSVAVTQEVSPIPASSLMKGPDQHLDLQKQHYYYYHNGFSMGYPGYSFSYMNDVNNYGHGYSYPGLNYSSPRELNQNLVNYNLASCSSGVANFGCQGSCNNAPGNNPVSYTQLLGANQDSRYSSNFLPMTFNQSLGSTLQNHFVKGQALASTYEGAIVGSEGNQRSQLDNGRGRNTRSNPRPDCSELMNERPPVPSQLQESNFMNESPTEGTTSVSSIEIKVQSLNLFSQQKDEIKHFVHKKLRQTKKFSQF